MHSSHPLRLRIEKNAGYILQWGKASARIGGVGHMNMQESVLKISQKKHGKELYGESVAVGSVPGKST